MYHVASHGCLSTARHGTQLPVHCLRFLWWWSEARDTALTPPVAPMHNQGDEYSWMQRPGSGSVLQRYLQEEADYCRALTHHLGIAALASRLRGEMMDRPSWSAPKGTQSVVNEYNHSASPSPLPPPERMGAWLWGSDLQKGVLLQRRPLSPAKAADEVVLDGTRLQAAIDEVATSTGLKLEASVLSVHLSQCHTRLVALVPVQRQAPPLDTAFTGGVGAAAALVMDCRDPGPGGPQVLAVVPGVVGVEWVADGSALLVTLPDTLGRPYQVHLQPLPDGAQGQAIPGSSGHMMRDSWGPAPTPAASISDVHTPGAGRGLDEESLAGPPSLTPGLTSSHSGSHSAASPQQQGPVVGAHLPNRVLLLHEPDPAVYLQLGHTKSWAYNVVNGSTKTSSEVHLLPAGGCALRRVQPRTPGLEYFVEHFGAHLVLLSNHSASRMDSHHSSDCSVHSGDSGGSGQQHQGPSVPDQDQEMDCSPPPGAELELMTVPVDSACWDATHWQPVSRLAPHLTLPPGAVLADMEVFNQGLLLHGRLHGQPALWFARLATKEAHSLIMLPLPSWTTALTPGNNADMAATYVRVSASSPVRPAHTFEWDMTTGSMQLLHVETASGQFMGKQAWLRDTQECQQHRTDSSQFQPEQYVCRQTWVASPHSPGGQKKGLTPTPETEEGAAGAATTLVPITLCYHQSVDEHNDKAMASISSPGAARLPLPRHTGSPAPVLLVSYGAYGTPLEAAWDPHLLPLLERGVMVAYVHARGGGELGRAWHAAGRGADKGATQADLLAAMQALVAQGFTLPGLIAGHAYSAGALGLAGAMLEDAQAETPLMGAAVLKLGFLDVTSAMCDPALPLTAHEYDEWGHPDRPAELAAMQQVCPYHSLGRLLAKSELHRPALPALLVSTATADTRVPCWGPTKWVARARRLQAQVKPNPARPLVLRVLWDAGHHAGAEQALADSAAEWAFILQALRKRWSGSCGGGGAGAAA